jgi:outer membrane protein
MKSLFVVLTTALTLFATGAAAQSVKVGVVNLARLESQSASVKRAIEALTAEFEPRNRQIEAFQKKIAAAQARLEKEGKKMSLSEQQALQREISGMMRKSDQMLGALKDEYDLRRRELAIRFIEEARAAIKTVAEAGKFDLILQEAAFARPSVDITDQVLKEMAKRGGGR